MPKRGSCGSVLPGCRLSKLYPSINSPAVRCCTSRARRDAHRTLLNSPVSDIARRLVARRLVPASRLPSRAAPAINPHSLAGAQLPATSCLGAFRPPATSSCGGSRDPGVRKPAQQRSWPASRVGTDGRRGERRRCCVSGWRREATLIHPVTHRSEGCQRRSLASRVDNSRLTM